MPLHINLFDSGNSTVDNKRYPHIISLCYVYHQLKVMTNPCVNAIGIVYSSTKVFSESPI